MMVSETTDLISRSALIEFARNHFGGEIDCNDIARFPTVDAVPVVRCRECRHCAVCGNGLHVCKAYDLHLLRTTPDGFCHRGAKKDGGAADD